MSGDETKFVNGLLVLYHHPLIFNAPTIIEHVNAFKRHSRYYVWNVNAETRFPENLKRFQFKILVLHYSLFVPPRYHLDEEFLNYIDGCKDSYKIAFFQDEYRYCQQRFDFINRYHIDSVYTLLEPAYFRDVYQKYSNVRQLVGTLPGYVSDDLIVVAEKMTKPVHQRKIDVGYRARRLAFYMGKGAQEKHEIAAVFKERANGFNLKMDILTDERRRIYGRAWYEFLANCRAVLGVEAGVSVFDLEDKVRIECERLISQNPAIRFEEISGVLQPWEGNIPYRTISPRHFEAAAFRVCQVLFEGKYSGVMQPMVHYIPLKKDFSNLDDVVAMLKDDSLHHEFTENAYRDLIASGRYSYQRFVGGFDQELLKIGFQPDISADKTEEVAAILSKGRNYPLLCAKIRALRYYPFPGRRIMAFLARPLIKNYKKLRGGTKAL